MMPLGGVVLSRLRCRAPLGLLRSLGSLGAALAVLAAVTAASACAGTEDGPLVVQQQPAAESATTTSSVAPPEPPASEGTVEIGDTTYRFVVTCYELGAGELEVRGTDDDPVAGGGPVELYLEANPSEPYVGLFFADGTILEPSLDSSLDLYLQDDVIRASAIRFVQDLDLETGTGTDIGFGALEIHCYDYSREPPE